MNRKLKPYKIVAIGSLVGLVTLSANPSFALSLNINNFLNQVLGTFNTYFQETKTDLTKTITNEWKGLQNPASTSVNNSTGAMGLPDPITSSSNLKDQLSNQGIWVETNTVEGSIYASNQLQRDTTRSTIESVLGQTGQNRTAQDIQDTQDTVADVQDLGEQAQSMDASQNVLKVIAAQNAEIASMLGQSRIDGLQQRHDVQQTNLMLNQVAEIAASDRERQNLLFDGMTAQYMKIVGASSLHTTASQ